jgi:hypothetical protein
MYLFVFLGPYLPVKWPFLFITIACGAISGFHALVSSGTSAKQVGSEDDSLFVGYPSSDWPSTAVSSGATMMIQLPETSMIGRTGTKLAKLWRLADRTARGRTADAIDHEVGELTHIFALLVLGVFVGLPSPPVQITLEPMPDLRLRECVQPAEVF